MKQRFWQIATVVLLFACFWLGETVVRLENYHYGSVVGMCKEVPDPLIRTMPLSPLTDRHECLHHTQTRTSSSWHLYYALFDGY